MSVGGIWGSSVLCEFLVRFCVGIRVRLVICLCGVVLGVFLCSVRVLVRFCLFLVVFYLVLLMCRIVCMWFETICVCIWAVLALMVSCVVVSGGVFMLVVQSLL